MFCSNDCFPAESAVYSVEGFVCSGGFRIHNSKVGGSIPPPLPIKQRLAPFVRELGSSNLRVAMDQPIVIAMQTIDMTRRPRVNAGSFSQQLV
jgi:hypothetical protein